MAGTFQLTYVPGYTLSYSSRGFSNSAVVLTKTTTARFPCSSFSSLEYNLNVRLTCPPNISCPFVCRASSSERDSERETTLRERFKKWCQTYNISYGGKEEWMKRFGIYKSNLQYIDYHNSLDLSYKLTDNQFADMTDDEFRANCCGARIFDEPEDDVHAEPEIASEYKEEHECDFDSEPGHVTAILEPEEEDDVALDVLSNDDDESLDEAVESENSSLERPAK